jgi:heptosyltransferase-1
MSPQILLVKTSSLGDVVHNLPVVTDIRRHWPAATIDWVVEEAFAELPALHPGVRAVIPVALRRWRRQWWRPATWRELGAFWRALRAREYDAVIDTQGLLKSALMACAARGPAHGQDRASAREALAALCYDRRYPIARGRHAIVRNRELAARALGYTLPEAPPDYGIRPPALTFEGELPWRGRPFVVCLHATSRAEKTWPSEHWAALAGALLGAGLVPVLLWGSEAERAQAEAIARAAPGAEVTPRRYGLKELAALLAAARAVVGVDTGLVHLAAALGCPTVALFGGSSPKLTGVWAADEARACNLGERGRMPAPAAVQSALAAFGVL